MTKPRNDSKDVLVTGASGVIGNAVARRLAQDGFRLHLSSRHPQKLRALQKELQKGGAAISLYRTDLQDPTEGEQVVRDFFQKADHPYGLVCNAGHLSAVGAFAELRFQDWSGGMAANFLSHAAMIHVFVQQFVTRRLPSGAIVTLSGAGLGGSASFAHVSSYSTAKAALTHLVEALAPELAPMGLTINAIAPGPVLSGMTEQALRAAGRAPDYAAAARKCKESGGVSPELAADMISFLMSEKARGVSGRLLSARFDQKVLREGIARVSRDPNLYRLRRIDGERFIARSQ